MRNGLNTYICCLIVLAMALVSCTKEPTCTDGEQNGGESGIDCGGECQNICTPMFKVFDQSNTALGNNNIYGVRATATGSYWLQLSNSSGGQGVGRFDGDSTLIIYNQSNTNLPTSDINDIHVNNDDTLYIAIPGHGLARFDGTDWRYFNMSNTNIPTNDILEIAEDRQGTIWLASSVGLIKFNGFWFSSYTTANSKLPSNDVLCVEVDRTGHVWAGTSDEGVAKVNPDIDSTWSIYNTANSVLESDNVIELAQGEGSAIWIGTDGGGMVKAFGDNWVSFTVANSELLSNTVEDIFVEAEGDVWVLAGCTYSKFSVNSWDHLATGTEFASFCANDILIDKEGLHWVATDNGLATFR